MARFSVAMALFDVTFFLIRAYNEVRLNNRSTFASQYSPIYFTSRRLVIRLLVLFLIEDDAARVARFQVPLGHFGIIDNLSNQFVMSVPEK